MPNVLPRRLAGTTCLKTAKLFESTTDMASACPTLKASNTQMLGASAAPVETARNNTRLPRISFRLPMPSPIFPASGWTDAITIRYAVTSQVAEARLPPKSATIPGSATAITVEFRGARIAPSATATSRFRSPPLTSLDSMFGWLIARPAAD